MGDDWQDVFRVWTGGTRTRTWSWAFCSCTLVNSDVNTLHSSFRLERWRLFFCASSPRCTEFYAAPPPTSLHSVSLLCRQQSSVPVQPRRIEPSTRRTSNTSHLFSFGHHLWSRVFTSHYQLLWGWDTASGTDVKFISGGGGVTKSPQRPIPVKNEQQFRISTPERVVFN